MQIIFSCTSVTLLLQSKPSLYFLASLKNWLHLNDLSLNLNDLSLNAGETEVLLVFQIPNICSIKFDGVPIQSAQIIYNLGVLFDSSLTFGPDVKAIYFLSPWLLYSLLFAILHCKITFSMYRIQPWELSHLLNVLQQLHWLAAPVLNISLLYLLLNPFMVPSYLRELIQLYTTFFILRSAGTGVSAVPRFKLKSMYGRSFIVAPLTLWNSLPQSLHDASDVK